MLDTVEPFGQVVDLFLQAVPLGVEMLKGVGGCGSQAGDRGGQAVGRGGRRARFGVGRGREKQVDRGGRGVPLFAVVCVVVCPVGRQLARGFGDRK